MPYYRWSLVAGSQKHGYPKSLNNVGDHLKTKRLDRGLKQKDVGSIFGVNTSTVYNWETGRTQIEVRYLPKVKDFLGYNPLSAPRNSGEAVRQARLARGWPIYAAE